MHVTLDMYRSGLIVCTRNFSYFADDCAISQSHVEIDMHARLVSSPQGSLQAIHSAYTKHDDYAQVGQKANEFISHKGQKAFLKSIFKMIFHELMVCLALYKHRFM